jgi:molecular chaperone GrpE
VTVENNEITEEEVSAKPPLEGETDSIRAERDNLKAERDELKDLLVRRQAEFENFRKRSERDRAEFSQYAGMEMVKDLLPILDDFDRALNVETADTEYVKGVRMIYNRLFESLKKQGLEPIDTTGATFDPYIHQAVERVETKDAVENTVLGEFQRGYNFKGKPLRPAMVRVAVKP